MSSVRAPEASKKRDESCVDPVLIIIGTRDTEITAALVGVEWKRKLVLEYFSSFFSQKIVFV